MNPRVDWLSGGGRVEVTAGTMRSRSPTRTRALLEPLLKRYGITRVASLTDLDILGVPVYSAIRPGAATLAASAGKGMDDDVAWISAVMESIEVCTAEMFHPRQVTRGSATNLGVTYSVRDLNLHPVSLVDDETALDWTPALDLVSREPIPLPCATIGLRGWTAERWSPALFVTTSNGLAAGNDPVEATVHGLLELIERHALSRGGQQHRTSVNLANLGPRIMALTDRLDAAGARVELEQMESLFGTATFVCYISQPEMPQVFGGTGCHLDPLVAVERAILEAVQSRASVISGLRDDIPAWSYRGSTARAAVREPRRGAPVTLRPAAEMPETLVGALDLLVAAVADHTRRPVLVVDLAEPDEPFPSVVQVFAPGLQPAPSAPLPRTDPQRGA